MKEKLNKDFYDSLPSMVCASLDHLIEKYGNESWFSAAWTEYRHHVLTSEMDKMKMPGFVFGKYVEK